jgi:hypothetical protein
MCHNLTVLSIDEESKYCRIKNADAEIAGNCNKFITNYAA